MSKSNTIKVKNYGDMLAQINNMELIDFYELGSYQGEYLAITMDDDRIFFFQGSYGSCSGCDWLEDEALSHDGDYEVKYKSALDYCGDVKPRWVIPKDDQDLLKTVLRLVKRFRESDPYA